LVKPVRLLIKWEAEVKILNNSDLQFLAVNFWSEIPKGNGFVKGKQEYGF